MLIEEYKKASDIVELEGYKNKWNKAHFEALLAEAQNVVAFVREEEKKLKEDETIKQLSKKDVEDVKMAEAHHGVTKLSSHISRILDEVRDYYDLLETYDHTVVKEKEIAEAAKKAKEAAEKAAKEAAEKALKEAKEKEKEEQQQQ